MNVAPAPDFEYVILVLDGKFHLVRSDLQPGQAGWQARLLLQVSLIEHMRDFARGIVDTRAMVFHLSLTGMFLFFTLKVVESRRWK